MSINIVSTLDDITINETLRDELTIYEYVNNVVNLLGEDVSVSMVINTGDKLITIKIK